MHSKRRNRKRLNALDPVTATISALTHDGRGVAHIAGKAAFIDGALPGETVNFVVTRRRGNHDEGKVVEIIEAGPGRVEPQCPHFGICGGCSLQHMQHADQLELKQRTLLDQLKHFGGVEPEEILPPLTGKHYGYRHKARLGVKRVDKKGKVLVGFREKNGRYLADCEACPILHESVGLKLTALSRLIEGLSVMRDIPQIEVAVGDNATALVIRHLKPLSDQDQEMLKSFAQENRFHIYLQPKGIDTIHRLWPSEAEALLHYTLAEHDTTLFFHPCDFTQVNPSINSQMVAKAIELLQPDSNDTLLDLFCGLGNFTLPLARHCDRIVGVEGAETMVERARQNAQHNNIQNAEFYSADLESDFTNEPWTANAYNKIIMDPPRTGALNVIQNIARFKARQIVYISCNPATLARDAGELAKQGYRLAKAGIMDMFPHTRHTEAIALFQ